MYASSNCAPPEVPSPAAPLGPLGPLGLLRLNDLRSSLEREQRTSEVLDGQLRTLFELKRECDSNADRLRVEIRRLVFSPNPGELA